MGRLPDGRFVLGSQGSLYVQTTWGSPTKTKIDGNNITFDPSFIAVRNSTSGLLGAGGSFGASSGLYGFNPSTPSTKLASTALATLQNYSAVYWKHPTSGREGWLIGGPNEATGKHNLTFVSADGAKKGAVTGIISTYSSGICVDSAANVFAATSEFSTATAADSEKVFKFTSDQIDAAVTAVISNTPAPVDRANATMVHQFQGAASIAVDATGRVWAGAYNNIIEVYDPSNGVVRSYTPDHPVIQNAAGPIAYQVQTFNHAGIDYVGFLASDSFTTPRTSIIQGYKPVSELTTPTRAVSFATAAATKKEADGSMTVTVSITPAPTTTVTVPITVSGTAAKGKDFAVSTAPVTFDATHTSQDITITIIDNPTDDVIDSKTVVLTLGDAVPSSQAFTALEGKTFTLTIQDDDHKPVIPATQDFATGEIGSAYYYKVVATGTGITKYTATGLPHGMSIDMTTGIITGRPTVAGEYDAIWITATGSAGVTTSKGFYLKVDDFSPAAHGSFVGLVDRSHPATSSLGARLDLSVAANASFTGKVTIGATPYSFSGPLDTSTTNPTVTATFTRNKTSYTLAFTIDANTGALSGAKVTGWKGQSATPQTGLHNFLAATPGGPATDDPHGATYGCVNLGAGASAVVTIRAADGATFASTAPLGPNGETLVYQSAYAVPGSMLGQLTIANDTPHTVSGSLGWTRPNQASGGWANEISLTAKGGKYRAVSGSTIIMDLPENPGNNGEIILQDGEISPAIHVPFQVSAPALVSIATGSKLTFTNSNGVFTGSYNYGGLIIPFQGMVVPDPTTLNLFDATGVGYFLTPGTDSVVIRSGMVLLSAVP